MKKMAFVFLAAVFSIASYPALINAQAEIIPDQMTFSKARV